MIRLEVLQGHERGRTLESEQERLLIGRGPTATLQLGDHHLSGEHGLIFREGDRYIYRDLRSTNGSMLLRGQRRILLDGTERWESGGAIAENARRPCSAAGDGRRGQLPFRGGAIFAEIVDLPRAGRPPSFWQRRDPPGSAAPRSRHRAWDRPPSPPRLRWPASKPLGAALSGGWTPSARRLPPRRGCRGRVHAWGSAGSRRTLRRIPAFSPSSGFSAD